MQKELKTRAKNQVRRRRKEEVNGKEAKEREKKGRKEKETGRNKTTGKREEEPGTRFVPVTPSLILLVAQLIFIS